MQLALLSAMLAAILTFMVTRLGSLLNRVKRRNVSNYNSLVKLEHLANEYGTIVDDNRQSIETIINAAAKPKTIPLNRLERIEIDKTIKINLQDIKLVNRLFGIEYKLRRINANCSNVNAHLDSFQSGIIGKNLSPDEYSILLHSILGEIAQLQKFMKSFLDELAELAAHVRIRLEIDETVSIKFLKWISTLKKRDVSHEEIMKEKRIVLSEIQESRKASVKERTRAVEQVGNLPRREVK